MNFDPISTFNLKEYRIRKCEMKTKFTWAKQYLPKKIKLLQDVMSVLKVMFFEHGA